MRDRPQHHRLEWPGGIVPEWARPQQNPNKRRRTKGGGQGGGKRERLQKVMAQSGHGSRRNIEILIAQGHITINGQVAKLGDTVGPGDKVKLDGNIIRLRFGEPTPRVLMYHKPEGEIVTRDDPESRPTVFEKLPKVNGGRWVSVGRLDLNTGGLLLFTTNGELANRLMHPRFEVEREYAVRLLGELTEEQKQKLLDGVDIEGDLCKFDSIEDRGGEGANHWYHVVLREGKNREVRKMCEAIGLTVSRLMRVRYGPVEMPSFLKRGQMKEMDETQVHELMNFAGMNEPLEGEKGGAEDEEDEHDNIGNRADYHANREPRPPRDVDGNRDNIGNRIEATEREVDGNRGNYLADWREPRPPKGGPRGQKPFRNKKRGGGQGQPQPQGQGQQHRKHGQGKPHGQPRAMGAQGEGQPRPPGNGSGNGNGNPPGAGKPGRHRRHKNRHRNRNAGGNAHGEAQPVSNGNRDPFAGG
jgi:23S rRNA pseudouridine2605 synthase